MNKRGRPRALDEAKQRELCALVSAGASPQQAAKYVGCSVATLKRESSRNPEFGERFRRAQANASLAPLHAMRQAAQTHWRAAAWMLERTDPEQFDRRRRHQLGAKELRALRRDLLEIFNDEIDHPVLRDRIAKRVKAAIDYAMRHAWDSRRTGNELKAAMEFFDNRESKDLLPIDPWGFPDPFSARFRSNGLSQDNSSDQAAAENNATSGDSFGAKSGDFCPDQEQNDTGIEESDDQQGAQK